MLISIENNINITFMDATRYHLFSALYMTKKSVAQFIFSIIFWKSGNIITFSCKYVKYIMLDDIDLQIMESLANNVRTPVLALSKKLGITNSTLRKRIKSLEDRGIIQFSCEVNIKKFPHILIMLVGIEA